MSTQFEPNLGLGYWQLDDPNWHLPFQADIIMLGASALGQLAVSLTENPSASLHVNVSAGSYRKANGTLGTYAGSTSNALPNNATTMLWLTDGGTLTTGSAFPTTTAYVPIATVTTLAGLVTTIVDSRIPWGTIRPAPFANKTTAYALTGDDLIVTGDATGAAFAITLPAASAVPAGKTYTIKKKDASGNSVTVTRAGADLIDGATTFSLASQFKFVSVISDGVASWLVVGSN